MDGLLVPGINSKFNGSNSSTAQEKHAGIHSKLSPRFAAI
jgi:hypothetical protein